jgi:hypothetical protein
VKKVKNVLKLIFLKEVKGREGEGRRKWFSNGAIVFRVHAHVELVVTIAAFLPLCATLLVFMQSDVKSNPSLFYK